jgi:hypothetical protein
MSNIVQSFWLGSHLPALQILSIRSFLAHGHAYHLYTFDPIENAPEDVVLRDASEILPRDSVFTYQHGFGRGSASAFSNLFRYKLLRERGGWWVDTDVVCLRPFDFDAGYVIATERNPDGTTTAASCVIKAPPGAEYLGYCLDVVQSCDKATIMWADIGPRLVNEAIARLGLERFMVAPDVFNPIDYSSFREIQSPGFDETPLANAFGVHLWNQMWKSYGLDPDYDGASDSLYAMLRRRYLLPTDRTQAPDQALRAHIAFQRAFIDDLYNERNEVHYALDAAERDLSVRRGEIDGLTRDIARLREDFASEARARRQESDRLMREIERMRGELAVVYDSFSWRITRPLRILFDLLVGTNRDSHSS